MAVNVSTYLEDQKKLRLLEQEQAEAQQAQDAEREARHNQTTDAWRLNRDRLICTCSVLAILVMVVQNFVVFGKEVSSVAEVNGTLVVATKEWEHAGTFTLGMEISIAVLSLASVVLTAQYYRMLLSLKQREWAKSVLKSRNAMQAVVHAKKLQLQKKKARSYGFFTSWLFPKFMLEAMIHLAFPYPFVEHTSAAYKVLQLVMFLRLYVLLRYLHIGSSAYRKRARINAYYADFRRMNLKIRWNLTVKMLFYNNSVTAVIAALAASIVIAGFCMYIIERDGQPVFDDPGNCVWFAFVTFSTIGYGEMVPHTAGGKVVAAFTGVAGHIIVALFGGILTNKLAPSKTQQLISVFLDNQTAEKEFQNAAATLIQSVWRETRKTDKDVWRSSMSAAASAATSFRLAKERDESKFTLFKLREHKRNRVYAAVKKFRSRRYKVAKAQLQASDPVIEQKLTQLQDVVDTILLHLTANDGTYSSDDAFERRRRQPSLLRQRMSFKQPTACRTGSIRTRGSMASPAGTSVSVSAPKSPLRLLPARTTSIREHRRIASGRGGPGLSSEGRKSSVMSDMRPADISHPLLPATTKDAPAALAQRSPYVTPPRAPRTPQGSTLPRTGTLGEGSPLLMLLDPPKDAFARTGSVQGGSAVSAGPASSRASLDVTHSATVSQKPVGVPSMVTPQEYTLTSAALGVSALRSASEGSSLGACKGISPVQSEARHVSGLGGVQSNASKQPRSSSESVCARPVDAPWAVSEDENSLMGAQDAVHGGTGPVVLASVGRAPSRQSGQRVALPLLDEGDTSDAERDAPRVRSSRAGLSLRGRSTSARQQSAPHRVALQRLQSSVSGAAAAPSSPHLGPTILLEEEDSSHEVTERKSALAHKKKRRTAHSLRGEGGGTAAAATPPPVAFAAGSSGPSFNGEASATAMDVPVPMQLVSEPMTPPSGRRVPETRALHVRDESEDSGIDLTDL